LTKRVTITFVDCRSIPISISFRIRVSESIEQHEMR
jgi:hypothetical protein